MAKNRTLGWREWMALPELGIGKIKAKIDTGARTSCLHAFYVEPCEHAGEPWVRFGVHPAQGKDDIVVNCEAPILDQRPVTDSGGHREMRYVIKTKLLLLDFADEIELTLTNRDTMRFRMLLGRTAMSEGGFTVDPSTSYLAGKPKTR